MIDRPSQATFIDEIETSVQLNGSRIVLIDYLQLISSNDKGKSKPQVIGKTIRIYWLTVVRREMLQQFLHLSLLRAS